MKKNILIIILVLISAGMMFCNESVGRIHTITTKQTDTSNTNQEVNVIIRTEGTKRIVSVPKSKNETITVGYQLSDGEFYKEDSITKFENASQYYEYVRNQNSILNSEDGILELENVGYYEGFVNLKSSSSTDEDYYDIEIIPQARKILIVIEGNGNPKVITFTDKYTLAGVDSIVLDGWVDWLKEDKISPTPTASEQIQEQRSKELIEQYRRISQRVYLSLNSPCPYKGLYEEGGEYLRKYLNIRFESGSYRDMSQSVKDAKFYVESNLPYKDKEEYPENYMETVGEVIKILIAEDITISEKIAKIKAIGGLTNKEFLTVLTGIKNNDLSAIENNGEIVPFLEDVIPGDIVSFNLNSRIESGLVVNISENRDKIEIAYMDITTSKARIIELSELNAKDVVIVRKVNGTKKDYKDANWNVLFDKIETVEIHIGTMKESTQKSNEKYRWIPNTGEYLILSEIKVTVKSVFGLESIKKDIPISLVGAVDRGFVENPTSGDYGNIYKNKATKFSLQYDLNIKSTYLLEKKQDEERYSLYITDDTGKKETGIPFLINKQGILTDIYGQKVTIQIRPDKDQIYPGDDLLLLFKIGETEYTVEPEDYIAVYDKKMLWRANQYIEEPEARLQNLDWNNAHPWNTNDSTISWYGKNDWLGDTNGGQIPIQGWTRFNDDEDVNGSVAYGWGCFDSIIAFNDELRKQSEAITKYKEDNNNKADKKYKIDWDGNSLGVYAPSKEGEKLWANYIFPNVPFVLEVEPKKLKDREEKDLFISSDTTLSVPGLSTYWYSLDMIKGKYYKYDQAVRTSGIDCSGLAYISTQYDGGKYETNQFNTVDKPNAKNFNGKTSAWISRKTVTIRPLSQIIYSGSWDLNPIINNNTPPTVIERRDNQRKLLSYAVPGDILVTDSHVVIIQDLQYEGDNTVITDYSQVYVIHSASGELGAWQTWKVHKSKWSEIEVYDSEKIKYQLRRLTREVVLK